MIDTGHNFDTYDEFQEACARELGHLGEYENPLELPYGTRVCATLEFRCPVCGGRALDTARYRLKDGVPVTDMDAGCGNERLVGCENGHDFVLMQCGTRFAFREAQNWSEHVATIHTLSELEAEHSR